jgi:hypothetical protein
MPDHHPGRSGSGTTDSDSIVRWFGPFKTCRQDDPPPAATGLFLKTLTRYQPSLISGIQKATLPDVEMHKFFWVRLITRLA